MTKIDCEGCRTRANNYCMWFDEDLFCPCSVCLIKMMCLEACELLNKYITEIDNLRRD